MENIESAEVALPVSVSRITGLSSPPTIAALCHAIDSYRDARISDARMSAAARMVCDDAMAKGFGIERTLVALKEEWTALADLRGLPRGTVRTDMINRFVTLCINEFYAASMPSTNFIRLDVGGSPS